MTDYTKLVAKWSTLSGTTAEKLAALNAEMVTTSAHRDVPVSTVVGKLLLSGSYLLMQVFAATTPTQSAAHDNALMATKMLMAVVTVPNAPTFQMSDPTTFAQVTGMMNAIVAYETETPGSTGFTSSVRDELLALANIDVPWWQANGYTSSFNENDLEAAGGLT